MFVNLIRSFAFGNRVALQRFCSHNVKKTAALALINEPKGVEVVQGNTPRIVVKKYSEIIEEDFIKSIKSANDSLEIMNNVFSPDNNELVSGEVVVIALRQIFLFQKSDTDSIKSIDLLQNSNFERLCRKLRRFSPALDVSNIVECLKILSFVGVPANSEISIVLLRLIQCEMNKLSLQTIMFLNSLLGKLQPSTGIHKAIQAALPTLFRVQLFRQLDPSNIDETVKVLHFMVNSDASIFNEQEFSKITRALWQRRVELNFQQTKSILWSLILMPAFHLKYKPFLEFCLDKVAEQEDLDYVQFIRIAGSLIHEVEVRPMFYQDKFFKRCAEVIVKQDPGLEKACVLLKHFKMISFVNRDLLSYIANKLYERLPDIKTLDPDILFTVVQAFSLAKFVPSFWNTEIVPEILKHDEFIKSTLHTKWFQFTLQLIVLGHFDRRLTELVLSKGYLKKYFQQQKCDVTDYLKVLILYQNVVDYNATNVGSPFVISGHQEIDGAMKAYLDKQTFYPFQSFLEFQLGEDYVLTRVTTKHGHYMQHLLKWNREKRALMPLTEYKPSDGELVRFEDVKCSDQEVLISVDGIMKDSYIKNEPALKGPYTLRRRLLEKIGVKVVEINYKHWTKLANTEQIPRLIEKIMTAVDGDAKK